MTERILEMTQNENIERAKALALANLFAAIEFLDTEWLVEYVDETVQRAFDELSEEADAQIFNPVDRVIEAYKKYKELSS